MSGVVASVVGPAVIGAGAQAYGAKKAADAQERSSDQKIQYMRDAENRARDDIADLYPRALQAQKTGLSSQLEMQQASAMPVAQSMQQGNFSAQNVLSGSMPQYKNALMGGPVDYGFAQPQQFSLQGLQDVLSRGRQIGPNYEADQFLQNNPDPLTKFGYTNPTLFRSDQPQNMIAQKKMKDYVEQLGNRISGVRNGTA